MQEADSGMLVCAIVFVVVCFSILGSLFLKIFFLNLSFNCFLFCCPEVLLQCSARLSPVAVRGSFSLCAASLVGEHRL